MKTKIPILIFLLLLAVVVKAQTANIVDPAQWKRYTVKGEEFSVTLPTLPAMASNKGVSAVVEKWRLERVLLVTSADGLAYSIYACENAKRQQSLKDFIADQAAKFGLDLATGRDLNVSGFPGKEYSARDKTKPVTEQFFATEGHLYSFVASGANADNAGVRQFFSSISLGKNQEGIEVPEGPGVPLEAAGAEKKFRGKEVDTKLRLTRKPEPSYTDEAKAKGVEGVVVLMAVFSSTGKVTEIRVVSGLPYGLTERAIEAAKKIKFVPAIKDGKYVSMWMQLEYNFNLY
jgi:TonB family protein